MMAGYHAAGRADEPAVFDLFFRHNPEGVDLVVCAGLEPVLESLEGLSFTRDEIDYLASLDRFDPAFLEWLAELEFTGDVWAIPEGEIVFGDEPLVRVEGPLAQAQLVETLLINRIAYSSLIASNALQVTRAARGKPVLEFGARRAHGPDGAITATRAAMIGGCASTSNVEAARRFGLPLSGTQAHSWVMAWESEAEAFRAYARVFPEDCILLLDTYDTLHVGLPHALEVADELAADGHELGGVRLDSGDLDSLSREVRARLDAAGHTQARIVVSGDLDAPRIEDLERADAPIDAYGVGTALVTARQDPAFSGVYKLAEVDGNPVLKVSSTPEKATNPGRKQVWRGADGDVIGLADEGLEGREMLELAMRDGRRTRPARSVAEAAERCRESVTRVGEHPGQPRRTERLQALRDRLTDELAVPTSPST
ncbi:nicotinate phosphoribosyltransferase [Egibacter rhizosphaerae]|uniref:Nicotinate phosphoribosyltransferase n=2 Tax=Egibacter rhizosphaerae TaxID=1670831 RepID=A0A411YL64_9ACTN|nr:nicotinate phosphoribosyltransferase [Egibacter rhizosphaerae]